MSKLPAIIAATTIIVTSAIAQTTVPPTGTLTDTQPRQSEFNQIEFNLLSEAASKSRRISDPRKRIEAYEKLLADFPKSSAEYYVNKGILDTYIEFWPQQTEKIQELIHKVIDPSRENRKNPNSNNGHDQVATQLIEAGILIDKAEGLAAKGLALFDEQEYIKLQERMSSLRKEAALNDEELGKRFRAERAKKLTMLGRVYLKKGKVTEAEKLFKEAYTVNPTIMEANLALAKLAIKAGNVTAALEYLTSAAVSGRLKPERRRQLEIVYRRTNKGSLDGLEQSLDAKYKLLIPNPIRLSVTNRHPPARTEWFWQKSSRGRVACHVYQLNSPLRLCLSAMGEKTSPS